MAAQRAFFQQAMGQAAAPTAAPAGAPVRPQTAAAPTRIVEAPAPGETPQRYMRPGSLLDIKV